MLPVTKEIKTSVGVVVCYDLTMGFITKIESGEIEDTPLNILQNATNLTEDVINKLRRNEANMLVTTVLQLTYPESYNEDGSLKTIERDIEDKKKV